MDWRGKSGLAGVLFVVVAFTAGTAAGAVGPHPTASARSGASVTISHRASHAAASAHRGREGGLLGAAASYLGVSVDALRSSLRSGKSLAQVANSTPGKSADGLIQALYGAARKQLDAAVAAGHLSQAKADQIATKLEQRITDLVNHTFTPGSSHSGNGSHAGHP